MATIYRFIVEQKGRGGNGGTGGASKKSTAKTITPLKLLTSSGDGVNHNRAMRGVNAVMNSVIPNYEKGVRLAKASLGLVKLKRTDAGGLAFAGFSTTAIVVILILALRLAMAHHKKLIEKEEKNNDANFKKLENGQNAIHSTFSVSSHVWSGKITLNENK